MTYRNKLLGSALALALSTTALSACNQGNSSNSSAGDLIGLTADESVQDQIRQAIAEAPKHGLKSELFLKGGESQDQLVEAALKYADTLANGYSDPEKLFEVYTIDRSKADVRPGLQKAFADGKVADYLNSLAPQTDEYRALGEAFLRYVKLAGDQREETIDTSKAIKPGGQDARIPKIASFLRAAGYLPADAQSPAPGQEPAVQPGAGADAGADAGNTTYTPQLVQAVKAYQAESALESDGILGGNTLDALNNGSVVRARQLAVALERLRWLQRDPPKTRVDVNTAATTLAYYRDGQLADQRRVVAGEADKPTPQLQSPMYRLVANPTWTVPKGIAAKELATKSGSWLSANDFIIKDGMYVQQAGPKSSLGMVKFDMQNDMAIYLHDTPAKALFSQNERHRSHGCVRVENAEQFATMLAQHEGISEDFAQAMGKEDQTFVKLPESIPVRLLYRTAFWDGSKIRYVVDRYGWDQNVAKALGLAPGRPQQIDQPESDDDIGP